ncbi:MAG: hypothetical protein PW788_11840 [Micavibrio sp.]|nr:hypothetical protein [Micavibrio sp.]
MSEHKCKGTCKKDFAHGAKKEDQAPVPSNDQKAPEQPKTEKPAHKCCGKCKP